MAREADWTRTGTVAGYAKYLRGKADALAVIVLRRIPELIADLRKAREEKRPARVELGPNRE
jgi:hypothetical protein